MTLLKEWFIEMRLTRNLIVFGLAIIALSFSTVDAQRYSTSGPTEEQVRKQILKLPYYEVFDSIGYQIDGSTVTLSGKVRNAINQDAAERAVKRIPGVARVINNIEVLPVGGFDESIRVRLYRRLSSSGGLSRYLWPNNPSVRLVVDRGHVSLEGYVANRGDYNSMNVLANGVAGVFSVTNNLKIDRERAY